MNGWLIRTQDFKTSQVQGLISESTRSQALGAASRKLAFFWGLALASVFLPVLHFVLVPLFAFIGLAFFFQTLRIQFWVKDLRAKCPDCNSEIRFRNIGFRQEYRFKCEACVSPLVLTRTDLTQG